MSEITQDTSDGYHTFRELYNHRRILTKALFNIAREDCWKSKFHEDGSMFENYFIVGINTHEGCATYHYHIKHWNDFDCVELANAPKWDGHTSDDAIERIDDYFTGYVLSQLQAYKEMCEVYEKANEFYGDEKKYFMREDEVDLNKTTAVFKESYRKNNPDVSKPNIYKGKAYECSARLKVDQGKTAREARAKVAEIKKKLLINGDQSGN